MKSPISRLLILFLFVLPCFEGFSQVPSKKHNVPEGYFISPVKHKIRFGGNFCELRNNHFHAGIDIKSSKGVPGDSIFAAADGHVRRLKVQRSSYGQTVYIDHAVGLTSVYAHLDEFAPELHKYIRENQYSKKSFEVDLYPDSTLFPIKKGQFIGLMGNRGHSFGAHLHFEIRDRDSEIPLNPLDFGFNPGDSRPPVFTHLYLSTIDGKGIARQPQRVPIKKVGPQEYASQSPIVRCAGWRAGISIGLFDRQNGASNKNGIYSIHQIVDGDTTYVYRADHCSFDETHQINAHMDYLIRQTTNVMAHRCYRLPNNTLSMYPHIVDNGWINLYQDKARLVELVITDHAGNLSHMELQVVRDETLQKTEAESFHMMMDLDKNNIFNYGDVSVSCPGEHLYHPTPLHLTVESDPLLGFLKNISTGNPHYALKGDMNIFFPKRYFPEKIGQCHLEYYNERTKKWSSKGPLEVEDSVITKGLNLMGTYRMTVDELAPVITPISTPRNVLTGQSWKWKVTDASKLSSSKHGLRWTAYLEEQWVLIEYDPKNDLLILPIDEYVPKGEFMLKIELSDFAGNERVWSRTINIL